MSEVNNEQQAQVNEEVENKSQESQTTSETTEKTSEKTAEVKKVDLTQEELDALIVKTKHKTKEKFADYDELKAKLAEFEKTEEERRQAEMSEIEKAQEQARKEAEAKAQLESRIQEMQAQIKREKVHNAFITAATAQNIAYIDDALKLAESDLSAVEIGDDGKPVGIEDVVKALVENKPFLVAQQQPRKIGDASNHSPEQKSDKSAEQLLKEAAEKARMSGKIEDFVAYDKLKRELR